MINYEGICLNAPVKWTQGYLWQKILDEWGENGIERSKYVRYKIWEKYKIMTKTLLSKSPFFFGVAWFFLQTPSMASTNSDSSTQIHPSLLPGIDNDEARLTLETIRAFYKKIDSVQVQNFIKALRSTDSVEDVRKVIKILASLSKETSVPVISNFLNYYYTFLEGSLPSLPQNA